MMLVKFNPFQTAKPVRHEVNRPAFNSIFDQIESDLDRIFGLPMSGPFANGRSAWGTHVQESEDSWTLELALPGYRKEQIDLEVDETQLKVFAVVEDKESANGSVFGKTPFERSFELSDDIDVEKISANLENGILRIALPKKEEAKKPEPRRIKVA